MRIVEERNRRTEGTKLKEGSYTKFTKNHEGNGEKFTYLKRFWET